MILLIVVLLVDGIFWGDVVVGVGEMGVGVVFGVEGVGWLCLGIVWVVGVCFGVVLVVGGDGVCFGVVVFGGVEVCSCLRWVWVRLVKCFFG